MTLPSPTAASLQTRGTRSIRSFRPSAPTPAAGRTLLATSAATMLVLMTYTAPVTTLPSTAAALGADAAGQTWILNGLPLSLAAVLLVVGNIADDRGRKRVFLIGTATLAATMAAGSLATSTAAFVAARMAQGVASAAILTTSLALIAEAFPVGTARVRAMGTWGAMVGAGGAVGPVLAGALARWGWGTAYLVLGAVAGVVTIAGAAWLVESRAVQPRGTHVVDAVALGLGLVALVAMVVKVRDGWADPQVWMLAAATLVLLAGFLALQSRRARPMLDLGLFRNQTFLIATLGAWVTGVAVIGLMSYLPAVVEGRLGLSPLATAVLFVAWSGTSVVAALLARRLLARVSARYQLALGLTLAAIGSVSLLGTTSDPVLTRFVLGLAVSGCGYGLVNGALPRLAVASVPADRAAMGSGFNNTARYVGSTVGVALVILVVDRLPARTGTGWWTGSGIDVAMVGTAAVALLGAVGAVLLRDHSVVARPSGADDASQDGKAVGGTDRDRQPASADATMGS